MIVRRTMSVSLASPRPFGERDRVRGLSLAAHAEHSTNPSPCPSPQRGEGTLGPQSTAIATMGVYT